MPELVTRLGAVISAYDAAAVVRALGEQPHTGLGDWRVATNRWELWSADSGERRLLAAVDVAHDVPYAHATSLTRVEITDTGLAAGLDVTAVVDAALEVTGSRLADCPRAFDPTPPVFSNRRRTDRTAWQAEAVRLPETVASTALQAAAAQAAALQAAAVQAAALQGAEAGSSERALDAVEDRELRRLHYLASFGGLTGGLANRYAELRARDRRAAVREPHDDDLMVLPRQRFSSEDLAPSPLARDAR